MPKSTAIPKDLPKLPKLPSGALKILIWSKETGEEFERWPIDARAMLASGHYTTTNPGAPEETSATSVGAPEPDENVDEVDPVPHVTAAAELAGKEHSPGVPLRATPAEKPAAKAKKAAPARKSQKSKEAGE